MKVGGEGEQRNAFLSLLKVAGGLGLLIGSSHLLVWGAVDFAKFYGVSDLVIGLTIAGIDDVVVGKHSSKPRQNLIDALSARFRAMRLALAVQARSTSFAAAGRSRGSAAANFISALSPVLL